MAHLNETYLIPFKGYFVTVKNFAFIHCIRIFDIRLSYLFHAEAVLSKNALTRNYRKTL